MQPLLNVGSFGIPQYRTCTAGVFVHVFRDPGQKPLVGFLPAFLFLPGERAYTLKYRHDKRKLHNACCHVPETCLASVGRI